MKKRQIILSILSLLFLCLLITSGTFAYFSWSSTTNKRVVFNTAKELKEYIIYDEGESKFVGDFKTSSTYTQGIHSTISLYKKEEASNVNLLATIKMDINAIGDIMKKSSALKWVVTEGTSSSIVRVISQGNFVGANTGDTLTLAPNIEVTTTNTYYTVWIWLDANANPEDTLTGETLDTIIWTEINQAEGTEDTFEITRLTNNYQMINATVLNQKSKIVGYQVTMTSATPDNFTNISQNDQSNVYTLEYTASSATTYYIWFQSEDENITSASITVSTIDTTAPVCTFGAWNKTYIKNNEEAQIVLTCIDNESVITANNITASMLTKSSNVINITDVSKTSTSNGYVYTISVKGTSTNGESTLTLPAGVISNGLKSSGTLLNNSAVTSGSVTVRNIITINSGDVTLSGSNFVYTGSHVSPTVTVVNDGITLTLNTDYTVTYTNNTNVGTGTVTVTGINDYSGTVTKTYNINNAAITFNPGSGSLIGTSPLYVRKNSASLYDGVRSSTVASMPSASLAGYSFDGWADSNNTKDLHTYINGVPAQSLKRVNFDNRANNNVPATASNGWAMTTSDVGTHINGRIIVTDSSLSACPSLDFNDVGITPAACSQNGTSWTIDFNFDVTSAMLEARSYNYDTVYRFIDMSPVADSAVINVVYLVKGGNKILNDDGSLAGVAVDGIVNTTSWQAVTAKTLYPIYVDSAGPTISSISASTSYDLTTYIDFTASDTDSKVAWYNVTTANTQPTTWIPVVSTVENITETKYDKSAAWARVFHHNTHWGTVLYSNASEASSSTAKDKYSVLGSLENYRNTSNKFEFLLEYPDVDASKYNRWIQTDNPATVTVANGTGSETAAGYTAVHVDWTGNYWGGLTLSTSNATYINGSVGHGNWFYAIGSYNGWNGAIPGPNSTAASNVNLWSRIDTKIITPLQTITRRIGDLKTNGTYYVWVRDGNGNVSSASIAVNRVADVAPTLNITASYSAGIIATTLSASFGSSGFSGTYYVKATTTAATCDRSTSGFTSQTNNTYNYNVTSGGTHYICAKVMDNAGNIVFQSATVNVYRSPWGEDAYLDDTSSTYVTSSTGINFANISSASNGQGLYVFSPTKNDAHPVYYFRGNVSNNNVLFGNVCWKIVRTTEKGGVKLVYNGLPTSGSCLVTTGTDALLSQQVGFNVVRDANNVLTHSPADANYMYGTRYVVSSMTSSSLTTPYKYGNRFSYSGGTYTLVDTITSTGTWSSDYNTLNNNHYTCFNSTGKCNSLYFIYRTSTAAGASYIILTGGKSAETAVAEMLTSSSNTTSSTIKSYIDTWYSGTLSSFETNLEDAIWCNDREIYQLNGWNPNGGDTSKNLSFMAQYRVSVAKYPSVTCNSVNDSFTKSSANGNGKLTYPVGLLTIDEALLAGAAYTKDNRNCYLNVNKYYWLMSPHTFQTPAYNYCVGSSMSIFPSQAYDDNAMRARPAISLKPGGTWSGNGTANNPYKVSYS